MGIVAEIEFARAAAGPLGGARNAAGPRGGDFKGPEAVSFATGRWMSLTAATGVAARWRGEPSNVMGERVLADCD